MIIKKADNKVPLYSMPISLSPVPLPAWLMAWCMFFQTHTDVPYMFVHILFIYYVYYVFRFLKNFSMFWNLSLPYFLTTTKVFYSIKVLYFLFDQILIYRKSAAVNVFVWVSIYVERARNGTLSKGREYIAKFSTYFFQSGISLNSHSVWE